MLIFGYLGEKNIIATYTGVLLGFIPFMIYYFLIYINYAVLSKNGYLFFWYFFRHMFFYLWLLFAGCEFQILINDFKILSKNLKYYHRIYNRYREFKILLKNLKFYQRI